MMPEYEIWRAAMATVKRYTADAMLEAAARADQRTTGTLPRPGIAFWMR
jgi:hypothetical protein